MRVLFLDCVTHRGLVVQIVSQQLFDKRQKILRLDTFCWSVCCLRKVIQRITYVSTLFGVSEVYLTSEC